MATKRMIHDRFFDSLDAAEWTIQQRYLVLGMIAHADDQGRLLADPRWLKKEIFPYDAVLPDDVQNDLEVIASNGDTVILYENDGRQYVQFSNWWDYQSLQWAQPSEYPAPENWQDRIRQLQYKPKRWVLTKNWPGADDCLSLPGEERTPSPKGNEKANSGGDSLPNRLPDASGNFNTNTPSNAKDSEVGGKGGSGEKGGAPKVSDRELLAFLDANEIPHPKSSRQLRQLKHPAVWAWMDVTRRWPCYDKLPAIARRLGESPNKKRLKLAWEDWVASDYNKGNVTGVLDFYEKRAPSDAAANGTGANDEQFEQMKRSIEETGVA